VKSYVLTICFILIYSIIIGLDYFCNWPAIEKDDILILISVNSIFITSNYALITRFLHFNIYQNYKNLCIAPLVPSQCFLMELKFFFKSVENILFFLFSWFFFIYFLGLDRAIKHSLSFVLYYIFILYCLIYIRFICGHNLKGRNTFYTICLLINSIVMYQILLISKGASNILANIIVEYNPINTLFFICVTKEKSIWYLVLTYFIFMIIIHFYNRKLSWEKQLEST
jgi:hypothetical protein